MKYEINMKLPSLNDYIRVCRTNKFLASKYKKVLLVPTGAIFSPTLTFQKESIPSIANAISLEVCE